MLEELLKSGGFPINVIATDEWLLKNSLLIRNIEKSVISPVSKEVLKSAISTRNPDGVAALVENSSISKFSLEKNDDFILILDRIQDPGNLGNIFRTALAGGVNKIVLGGGANPLTQKVLRASCGSIFHLPFMRIEGNEDNVIRELLMFLETIKKNKFQIISTSSKKNISGFSPKPYWELNWSLPTALILGNEGSGIHPKIQETFRDTITIPHNEIVESLNVACVAVPLLLERKRVTLTSILKKK